MDKVIKNLYDRLYRKGLNVPKEEIKAAIVSINAEGNLSDDDKNIIVKQFTDKYTSQLAIPEAGATTTNLNQSDLPKDDEGVMTLYEPVNKSSITLSEAKAIVFSQVETLELELKTSEIKAISQELYEQDLDANDAVNYAIGLIRDYISAEEQRYTSDLTTSMQGLVDFTNASYQRRNTVTANAFSQVRRDLGVSRDTYKSSVRQFKEELQEHFQPTKSVQLRDD